MKLKNSTYDALKYLALVVLPAVATLWGTLAKIWGLPYETQIPMTIMAVDTFLGVLLQISTNNYRKDLGTGDAEKEGGVDV